MNPAFKSNSLSRRFVIYIVLFSSLFTLISSGLQLYTNYKNDISDIEKEIYQIEHSYLDSLTNSVWQLDDEQINKQLQGILALQNMAHIAIYEGDKTLYEKGHLPPNRFIQHSYDIIYDNGQKNPLGRLSVTFSLQQVYDKLRQQFFIILIGKMIQTFCVSLFIIFIFYELIAKHLNQMARYAKNLTLDKLDKPLILNKTNNGDELDQVSTAINAMCVSLENDKRQLQEGEKNRIRLAQAEKEKEIAERLSITDELTQLYNRRYFNNEFPKEIHRATRSQQIISFLMFDVDYFKLYNDNYGHQKGDDVLREIGQIVKAKCHRAGDIPIRLGGEEFGVIFSSVSNQQAFEFADSIRMAIYNANIEHNFSHVCHCVTASFGLITSTGTLSLDDSDLYKHADNALYQAKEGGRNRVIQVCI